MYGTHPYGLVVEKVETGCQLSVLHHVASRTGGCHGRLVTGTGTVHMLLIVVIQSPCRRNDSPRVQHSPPFIKDLMLIIMMTLYF